MLMQAIGGSYDKVLACARKLVDDGDLRPGPLPDKGPIADNLPDEETSENLPPHVGLMDPPSWWSSEMQARREASKNIDRALAGVKVKPTGAGAHSEVSDERRMELLSGDATRQTPAHKRIRRFAFKAFGDWEKNKISTIIIMQAAENDPDYKREAGVVESKSTFDRALGRK
jgi:hypothetical protein